MKRLIIVLAAYAMITVCDVSMTVVVPAMCENITRRTYLLSRLERIMNALKKFNATYAHISISETLFKHPELITIASLINSNNNLDSMFVLWEKLKEYKNIDDFLLMQEFTKLILVLPSHIQPNRALLEQTRADIHLSLEGTSYIEAVTLRRYYAERLKRAIAFLNYVPCGQKDFFEEQKPGCDCSFITNYEFRHGEIKKIIENMQQENTLMPLIKLAHEFNSLKLINDSDFQKQFMVLIFTTYRNLVINNAAKYNYTIKKNTLATILTLYDNIERIPLEQILDAIDVLAEELPIILEKYEFNSKISWKKWLEKYWWMTTLALSSVGYKIMRIFYPSRPRPNYQRPSSTSFLNGEGLP